MAAAAGNVIEGTNTILPAFGDLRFPGVPVNGSNEVQTLTIGGAPTAGAGSGINFTFQGLISPLALWSATNATWTANLQAALDTFFGAGATVVTVGTAVAGVGTMVITFSGAQLAAKSLGAAMGVINAMTGAAPTASVARTTPGVDATFRSAATGQNLMDTTPTTGEAWVNIGTPGAPNWTKIGVQV